MCASDNVYDSTRIIHFQIHPRDCHDPFFFQYTPGAETAESVHFQIKLPFVRSLGRISLPIIDKTSASSGQKVNQSKDLYPCIMIGWYKVYICIELIWFSRTECSLLVGGRQFASLLNQQEKK